jgi:hypothetical protein
MVNLKKLANFLKTGVTAKDVLNYLNKETLNERLTNLRQMCYELLSFMGDRIDDKNKKLVTIYIETIDDIKIINVVITTLSINYFFGNEMTFELLMDKIKLNHDMKKFIDVMLRTKASRVHERPGEVKILHLPNFTTITHFKGDKVITFKI